MKKILFIISLMFFSISYAANDELSIVDIDSSNSNLLKIFVDTEIEANSSDLSSDLKLFEDLNIENIARDLENDKLVKIVLKDELEKNTSYSLLPIFWVDWSIDFKIEDLINGLEIKWSSLDGVDELKIIDSTHLDVLFSNAIESDNVDVKILKEYWVKSLKLNPDNTKEIQVFLDNSLVNNKNYLVMMFALSNSDWKEYSIKNYIYDFTANVTNSDGVNIPEEDKLKQDSALKNTALNSAETPDTGPETWILLLFTFIISSIVFIRKKFN